MKRLTCLSQEIAASSASTHTLNYNFWASLIRRQKTTRPRFRMPRNASLLLLFLLSTIYFQSTVSKTRIEESDGERLILQRRSVRGNQNSANNSLRKTRRRHSGRLLGRPNPVLCARRPRTVRDMDSGHFYFFSDDTNYRVSKEVFSKLVHHMCKCVKNTHYSPPPPPPSSSMLATCLQGHKASWLDARNLCRERCMDLASLETPQENEMMRKLIEQRNLRDVWTSGRMCNFHGCNKPHLQPRHINGKISVTISIHTVYVLYIS